MFFCNIDVDQTFWFTIRLLSEPWEWTIDFSTKSNISYLTQPTSASYLNRKFQIEKAVIWCFWENAFNLALAKIFQLLIQFDKK